MSSICFLGGREVSFYDNAGEIKLFIFFLFFFGGRGKMSPAFWLYLRYEPGIVFGETKVSLTWEKSFVFVKKQKLQKYLGLKFENG